MKLEIIPIGGFSEVGRNSTLVKYGDDAVILDLGLHMDNYIAYTDDDERDDLGEKPDMSAEALMKAGAVPDINQIKELIPKVKAICISHAHLDHLGAVPFLANKFPNAGIHGTKYTIEVLKQMLISDRTRLKNKFHAHNESSRFKISKDMSIEFVRMTHSVPQTASIMVHTPEGTVAYVLDFKLDNAPVLGEKPDYQRLTEIGKKGVKVLIMDTLYAHKNSKTPSESIAREMLKDVLLGVNSKGNAIVVTTFASHIARLNTIIDLGRKLKRRVILIGRSFDKYVTAAKKAGVADLTRKVEMVKYGSQVKKYFGKVKNPEKCLFVVTGHQAEPGSILPRMVFSHLFKFKEEDNVIFSCSVIPVESNVRNRERLDAELKKMKVRIFTDVHVSGHAYREDHREMIKLLRPKIIIPTHAPAEKLALTRELAMELGYKSEDVKILKNGERITL
ncbi:MBL fold metallo-hydrolase [Candidatus Woesearchaeota archaeon]|nr:MBL fold metallo-hydrolase [Candidatus Woesearchaeota archaeon]